MAETNASSPLVQQETGNDDVDGGVSSKSWMSGEVTSTSTHNALNTSQRPETSGYDCVTFELEGVSHAAHMPLGLDPGCSSALDPSGTVSMYSDSSLSAGEQPAGFHNHQQRALAPTSDEPQIVSVRTDAWQLQEQGGREDSGGKPYVCSCCGKTLACLKNLKTHMRVHTGEKPFICPLCGKRFSDSSNLKRHQSVHTGEKRYGCIHCGKRFAQSGSLKVHMSVHTDCKQFKCSHCGKTFISGAHLRRHVAIHAEETQFAASLS